MVIMALGLTFTGYAQQPSSMERDTLGLEEVVITANRIEEKKNRCGGECNDYWPKETATVY